MYLNLKTTTQYLLFMITIYLGLISLGILYLALQGDTTYLGDPYYEDQILAPERAFIPWLLTWLTVGVSIVITGIEWYQRKHSKK